jgi:hypothetical protein
LRPSVPAAGRWLPYAAHLAPPLWLFAGPLFEGRVLFFRDLCFYYFPNYVFVAGSLAQGVWPLWNPTSDAGAPYLMAYPLELAVLATAGARAALAVLPPLHVWIAMCGATYLCRTWGAGAWGAWAAGLFYGASGFVLSAVNLMELFHASAWAPWVVSAILHVATRPTARAVAVLAVAAALQLSTLSAEVILQTALAGVVLLRALPRRRAVLALATAAVLAGLLASPVLLGVRALVAGTARAEGFATANALAWSARGPVLLEALMPRLFGNVHSFSDAGYWGQPFFPTGQPYLLSLYLGLGVVVLALAAGTGDGRGRWWLLFALGLALALGRHGPLAAPLTTLMTTFRSPIKFAWLANLALCVLAGLGVDRVRTAAARGRAWALAPGVALAAAGAALWRWPDLPSRALSSVVPALAGEQARAVAAHAWPPAFLLSGLWAVGVGVVVAFVPRWAPLAALLAGLDLVATNSTINTAAESSFYALRPPVRALAEAAAAQGAFRWFSYGIGGSPALRFSLSPLTQNHDVWLYYLDRQSLRPRTQVLDGLEGTFDEDRVGWAPPGSTLSAAERTPGMYRQVHDRLRLANVRWVLSFDPLPEDLVIQRGEARLPEVVEPLRLYELRAPLPRAFWAARADGLPEAGAEATVSYERLDAHGVRLRASTPPGYLVVLNGYHRDWHADGTTGPLPVVKTHGRHWAVPTPGGEQVVTVRYRPAWRGPALVAAAVGALAALGLAVTPWPLRRRARAEESRA